MSLTVLIPTRVPDRTNKLMATLRSLPAHEWLRVLIVCDGGGRSIVLEVLNAEHDMQPPAISVVETAEHVGAVAARNAVIPHIDTDILWATDDIEFREGAIEHAYGEFQKRFPDGDGVVGFVQDGTGGNFHPTGVGITGQAFLDRYPDHLLFFPEYWHFACQEIHWLANDRLGKFYQDPEAILFHRHPSIHKLEMDRTHSEGRTHKREDQDLARKRRAAGEVWGSAE